MATITPTAANFIPSANAVYLGTICIAGEAITAAQPVYLHTDSKYYRASAASAAASTVRGIAANSAAANQRFNVVSSDTVAAFGSVFGAAGAVICISDTVGSFCLVSDLASGDFVTVAGVSKSATTLQFDFSNQLPGVQIP